jgi:hypothetical protein
MESINVVVKDISIDNQQRLEILNYENEPIESKDRKEVSDEVNNEVETESNKDQLEFQQKVLSSRIKKNHPSDLIIRSLDESRKTGDRPKVYYKEVVKYACYTSTWNKKNVKEALIDEH